MVALAPGCSFLPLQTLGGTGSSNWLPAMLVEAKIEFLTPGLCPGPALTVVAI